VSRASRGVSRTVVPRSTAASRRAGR